MQIKFHFLLPVSCPDLPEARPSPHTGKTPSCGLKLEIHSEASLLEHSPWVDTVAICAWPLSDSRARLSSGAATGCWGGQLLVSVHTGQGGLPPGLDKLRMCTRVHFRPLACSTATDGKSRAGASLRPTASAPRPRAEALLCPGSSHSVQNLFHCLGPWPGVPLHQRETQSSH